MPIFEYRGLSKKGDNVKGIIDADNVRNAKIKLKKDGVFVTDIKDKKKTADLEAAGFTVLRFTNDEVLKNIHAVCSFLEEWIEKREKTSSTPN